MDRLFDYRASCGAWLRRRIGFALALTGLGLTSAGAEDKRILFTNLSPVDGLPEGEVRSVARDAENTWLGTQNGLVKFDGSSSEVFTHDPDDKKTLSADAINVVFVDSNRWVWVGAHYGGLNRFNLETEEVLRFRHNPDDPYSLSHDDVTAIAEDTANEKFLWVGTSSGLNRLDVETGQFTRFLPNPDELGTMPGGMITVLLESSDSELWIGTKGSGLCRYDQEAEAFERIWSPGVGINSIQEDRDNTLWIGTDGGGVYRMLKDAKEPEAYAPGGIKMWGGDVNAAHRDGNGTLWIATDSGLGRYDEATDSHSFYRHNPSSRFSLGGRRVLTIFGGSNGVVWVGLARGGVSRFSTNAQWFAHFQHQPGVENSLGDSSVWDFDQSEDNTVLVATDGGLSTFSPESGSFSPFTLPEGGEGVEDIGEHPRVLCRTKKGALWMGTKASGVGVLSPEGQLTTFRHIPGNEDSLPRDGVRTIYEDSEGVVWVGTIGGGLAVYRENTKRFKAYQHVPGDSTSLSSNFITTINEDLSNRLWIGTMGGGLNLFDRQTGKFERITRLSEGRADSISCLLPSRRFGLLVGSIGGGLIGYRHDDRNLGTKFSYQFKRSNAEIPHDSVHSMIRDTNGHVWLGTGNGIARFDENTEAFRRFDVFDGLQGHVFHENASLVAADGKVFLGGPGGFNIVDPKDLPELRTSVLSNPILKGLWLGGNEVKLKPGGILERPLAATSEIRIPQSEAGRIDFTFITLDDAMPGRIKFRYKLDGSDDDWRIVEGEQKATYMNLDPGKYEFIVQTTAVDMASRKSTESERAEATTAKIYKWTSARVELVVLPPWHQTWWARAGLVFLSVGLVAGIMVFRMRVHAMQLEKQRGQLEMKRQRAEAELARQFQRGMLLENTAKEMRQSADEVEVLTLALNQLQEHLGVAFCHLHSYSASEGKLGQVVASAAEGSGAVDWPSLEVENTYVSRAVARDRAAVVADDRAIAQLLGTFGSLHNVKSLVLVRTSYQNAANGVLVIEQCAEKSWSDDDIQLVEAVAGQVGLAIAQNDLVGKEEAQRRELEQAKVQAEVANKAKTEFLAKMTHELRTPLNSILGFAQLLSREEDTNESQRDTLEIINNSGEHLLEIINDVLEISKIEAGRIELVPERFALDRMMQSVKQMLAPKALSQGVDFRFDVGRIPNRIVTDKGKLRQVLVNLLGNALKFTDQGSISLKVWSEEIPKADGTSQARLFFEIRDTGRGIAQDEIGNLFQKFVQAEAGKKSHQGTGLGLAISKHFIQIMGGDVTVESELGVGTVFKFDVVCDEVDYSASEETADHRARMVKGLVAGQEDFRILVAEDQIANRLLIVRLLKSIGFNIVEAVDGAEAVRLWREWEPHLIFMDNDMPEMNGIDATKTIVSQAKAPPVIIALTACALENTRVAFTEAGCDDFLTKPYKSEDLFDVIARYLKVDYIYEDDVVSA